MGAAARMATAVAVIAAAAVAIPPPQTFGKGIPNFPFSNEEQVLYEHTLSAGSTIGAITHMWSTACGANANPDEFTTNSGVVIYRIYVDGEETPSIELTPRMAAGIGFPPLPLTPGGGGGGGGELPVETRQDEFVIGDRGATCDNACTAVNLKCSPNITAGLPADYLGDFMSHLVRMDTGAACDLDSEPWWAPDQPSFVWAENNTNYGKCLGFTGVPDIVACNGSHPLVNRMCRCVKSTGGPLDTRDGSATTARGAVSPSPDAAVPWGTEWLGRTSDMDGYYWNLPGIPFYRSVRVTGMVPRGLKSPFTVYSIVRGHENVPVTVAGYPLPSGARLRLHSQTNTTVPSLGFIPVVNKTSGSGVIFGHVIAIEGNPAFTYLEGCWHLITNVSGNRFLPDIGVSANFPGTTLSTGMEDYYDSSFYFHAGIFQLPVSGVTHMCAGGGRADPPHPACPNRSPHSEWSAYRIHDKDPLWFSGGVQLLARNGDVASRTPYGSGKCGNTNMQGGPGPSVVSTLAWVYEWDD